jgi:predicted membrane channel-forming protein YqfA (hemolysin III family)
MLRFAFAGPSRLVTETRLNIHEPKSMSARISSARIAFVVGAILAVLALVGFLLPFFAALAGDFEGGEQSLGGIMLLILFGMPATLLLVASVLLHGWRQREARPAYFVLSGLFAIPILILLVSAVGILIYEAIKT